MGAGKVWTGDLQTPCGSAGEARFILKRLVRRSFTPHPVPETRAADGAWANVTAGHRRCDRAAASGMEWAILSCALRQEILRRSK